MNNKKSLTLTVIVAVFAVFLATSCYFGWDAAWMPSTEHIILEDIPAYDGEPYVVLYDNQPLFTDEEKNYPFF